MISRYTLLKFFLGFYMNPSGLKPAQAFLDTPCVYNTALCGERLHACLVLEASVNSWASTTLATIPTAIRTRGQRRTQVNLTSRNYITLLVTQHGATPDVLLYVPRHTICSSSFRMGPFVLLATGH